MALSIDPVYRRQPFRIAHPQLAVRYHHGQIIQIFQTAADQVIIDIQYIADLIRAKIRVPAKSRIGGFIFTG